MRGFKIYLIIGSLLLIIYLVAQFNKPIPTDWTPSLLTAKKTPFGTYIFYSNLRDMVPANTIVKSNERIYNTLKDRNYKNTAYIILASNLDADAQDYAELQKFAAQGNTVFIAASTLGKVMPQKMKLAYGMDYFNDLTERRQYLNFTNPKLKKERNYSFDKNIGGQFFKKMDTAKTVVLGITSENKPNFLKYPVKSGAIYLITDPLFFSNYNMLEPFGAEYAAKVMSYIGAKQHVIYDEYYTVGRAKETDILQFILNNKPLRYAYWLGVGTLLFFLLFEIKRRQKVIPILDPYVNTSVGFVEVVTSLYFKQQDNRGIAEKRIIYFLDHLRTRYFWKGNETEKDFEQHLSSKTGISAELAKSITMQIRYIRNEPNVHDDILINLNNLIEQFYKESK